MGNLPELFPNRLLLFVPDAVVLPKSDPPDVALVVAVVLPNKEGADEVVPDWPNNPVPPVDALLPNVFVEVAPPKREVLPVEVPNVDEDFEPPKLNAILSKRKLERGALVHVHMFANLS